MISRYHNPFKRLLTTLFVASSSFALAQTSEINQAKRDYERQQAVTGQAERKYNRAVQQTENQKAVIEDARRKTANVRARIKQNNQTLRNESANVVKYRDLAQQERTLLAEDKSRKAKLLRNKENLLTRKKDNQSRIASLTSEIKELSRQIRKAEADDDKPTANRLKARKKGKVQVRKSAQDRLKQINQQLQTNAQGLKNTNARIAEHQANIRSYQSQREASARNRDQAKSRQSTLETRLENAKQAQANEIARLRDYTENQREKNETYRQEKKYEQELYSYYQNLLQEYERQKSIAITTGRNAGNTDGSYEGTQVATDNGSQRGYLVGAADGERKAKKDVEKRDYVEGYKRGFANGSSSPELLSFYQSGFSQGESIALSKAKAESFPKGYNDSLSQTAGATPSKQEAIDISQDLPAAGATSDTDLLLTQKNVGFVSVPSTSVPNGPVLSAPTAGSFNISIPATTRGSYSPPCSNLDSSELQSLCRNAYDSAYSSGFKNSYGAQYETSYIEAYNSEAAAQYRQNLATRNDDALASGQQAGAKSLGLEQGYSAKFKIASEKEYASGAAAFAQQKASGYLVKFVSASLEDSNKDGLFTNGEKALLSIVIDNLGLAANPIESLSIRVKSSDNITQFSHTLRNLPSLAGDTRTTIQGVLKGLISSKYAGSKLSIEAALVGKQPNGSQVEYSAISLEKELRFPLELVKVSSEQVLSREEDNEIDFTFKNNGSSDSDIAVVKLDTLDSQLIFAEEASVDIPSLPAGESHTVRLLAKAGEPSGLNPNIVIKSSVDLNKGAEQLFSSSLKVKKEAAIRLFLSNGQRLTSGIKVPAGVEFAILADMEYLSDASSIGPVELGVAKRSAGINFGNNSAVSINYGQVSANSNFSKSVFRFRAGQELKGKTGEVLFQLKSAGKLEHIANLKITVQ